MGACDAAATGYHRGGRAQASAPLATTAAVVYRRLTSDQAAAASRCLCFADQAVLPAMRACCRTLRRLFGQSPDFYGAGTTCNHCDRLPVACDLDFRNRSSLFGIVLEPVKTR